MLIVWIKSVCVKYDNFGTKERSVFEYQSEISDMSIRWWHSSSASRHRDLVVFHQNVCSSKLQLEYIPSSGPTEIFRQVRWDYIIYLVNHSLWHFFQVAVLFSTFSTPCQDETSVRAVNPADKVTARQSSHGEVHDTVISISYYRQQSLYPYFRVTNKYKE